MVHDDQEQDGQPDESASERDTKAYSSAMEAVFALPIAMGIGWWADTRFDTSPWLLFVGLAFGFATFVMRLMKMRQLVEEASEEHQDDEPF